MSIATVRILIALALTVVLFLAFSYFSVPSRVTIQISSVLNSNTTAASRTINYKWKNIFDTPTDTAFEVDGYRYHIDEPIYNGSHITIKKNRQAYHTNLSLIQKANDTCFLTWNSSIETGENLFFKAINYYEAKALQRNMYAAANRFRIYVSKVENVYQYKINHTTLTDTVLIFTQKSSSTYPTTTEIYALVDKLRMYISANQAKETNSPMLHIAKSDNNYVMMVGIPTNIELKPKGAITIKHLMPIENKMLTTDVQGGLGSIKNAYRQIEQYMQDHSFSAPVIPFELMITDRDKEADTTKWKTKILYPII